MDDDFPDLPGIDLDLLVMYERQQRQEQQRRDEAYRLPLRAPEPPYDAYRAPPEPAQDGQKRGVVIMDL